MKDLIKGAYGEIASGKRQSCCDATCSSQTVLLREIGYSEKELKSAPQEANLGLGCGNPTALASLKKGEVVLDLGSGAGFDCFLAASRVGPKGKVIGVDMTQEMVERAKTIAEKDGIKNVEFRLSEIENLPCEDESIDVVMSNCVINLSPDKQRVFQEIYRVLKPGGRIAISDIGLLKELPKKVRENINAYVGCVAGALLVDDYKRLVESSGLKDVKMTIKGGSSCIDPKTKDPIGRAILDSLGEGESLEGYVVSLYVEGYKRRQ